MTEQEQDQSTETKDRHPLITLGLLTAGTQIGSTLIQRMGRHPALLFAMGIGAGVYSYKNRKQILAEVQQLGEQGKRLIPGSSDTD